jgi:hypothetical protein
VAGSRKCGDEPRNSSATKLVISVFQTKTPHTVRDLNVMNLHYYTSRISARTDKKGYKKVAFT